MALPDVKDINPVKSTSSFLEYENSISSSAVNVVPDIENCVPNGICTRIVLYIPVFFVCIPKLAFAGIGLLIL